jgi:hypothetical protein
MTPSITGVRGIFPARKKLFVKPFLLVILNEVKDLKLLKIRDSSFYMKMLPVGRASVPAQIRAARDVPPTSRTGEGGGSTFSFFVLTFGHDGSLRMTF